MLFGTVFATININGGIITMEKKELIDRISKLETLNDQLLAELEYIDSLAKQVGFIDGIKTLKLAALEMIEEQESDNYEPPEAI